jgi:uncharacterized membrane protein SpoIIM required for sporulation
MAPEDRLEAALAAEPVDADRLMLAYRDAGAALARARSDPAQAWREERLNTLLGRAHALLFRSPLPAGRRLLHYLAAGWLVAAWDQRRYTAAAAALFLGAWLATFRALVHDPDAAAWLLSAGTIEDIFRWSEAGVWLPSGLGAGAPLVVFETFKKNAGLALEVTASGLSLGLGSAWSLLENGVSLGAVWACAREAGGLRLLATFTSLHGALEFPAIFLAGGSGLRLGAALVAPGERSRRVALVEEGREASLVTLSAVGLLAAAALLEGAVSPRLAGSLAAPAIGGALSAGLTAWTAWAVLRGHGWVERPDQTGPAETSRR